MHEKQSSAQMNWLQIAGGKKMEPDKVQWHMQINMHKKATGKQSECDQAAILVQQREAESERIRCILSFLCE